MLRPELMKPGIKLRLSAEGKRAYGDSSAFPHALTGEWVQSDEDGDYIIRWSNGEEVTLTPEQATKHLEIVPYEGDPVDLAKRLARALGFELVCR